LKDFLRTSYAFSILV